MLDLSYRLCELSDVLLSALYPSVNFELIEASKSVKIEKDAEKAVFPLDSGSIIIAYCDYLTRSGE